MQIPAAPLKVLERLSRCGYKAYVVGGCVRDALLGRTPADWDVATCATPEEVLAVFSDCRTIDTGIKHGTVTVLSDGQPIEVTTFRVDGTYTDHRRPDKVHFTRSLREDLARRDFTVNAMAYNPHKGLVDPFGGQADLQAKVLRCVGNPVLRFQEDALRIARAVRFSAVLGFSMDPLTDRAVRAGAMQLYNIAAERLAAELRKLLSGKYAKEALLAYPEVICTILPELRDTVGFAQPSQYHAYDVYTHTAICVQNAPADDPYLRLAALLHDCAKPQYFSRDAAGGHFRGHPAGSAQAARAALRRLKLDNRTVDTVTTLILCHDEDIACTRSSLLGWLARLGEENLYRMLALKRADALAKSPETAAAAVAEIDEQKRQLDALLADSPCYSLAQLAVNGSDLCDAGISPGPMVGQVLHALLEAVIEGRCPNDRAVLLKIVSEICK